jgi:hypothetical protein
VERGQAEATDEAYRAVDIFTRRLWYHQKNAHVLYDNAHMFANVMKQMLGSVKNRNKKDKLKFNPEMRKRERSTGTDVQRTIVRVRLLHLYRTRTSYVHVRFT